MRRLLFGLALLPALVRSAPPLQSDEELVSLGARIGRIAIERIDVFDPRIPGERNFMARSANLLHIRTRERVIRRELLFHEGDPYRPALLRETERNLRDQRFLYNVHVRPTAYRDGVVDLLVSVQDSWTTRLSLRFKSLGGSNTTRIDIKELNLAGLGKRIDVGRLKDIDRSTYLFGYEDPRLFGSRFRLQAEALENSDGSNRSLLVERPFFSLASTWAFEAEGKSTREDGWFYEDGHVATTYEHHQDQAKLLYGWSRGIAMGRVVRYRAGAFFDDDRFHLREGFPSRRPFDRRRAGIEFQIEYLRDRFFVGRNMDEIERDEDFNLGPDASLTLLGSARAFSADEDLLGVEATWKGGFDLDRRNILFYKSGFETSLFASQPAQARIAASAEFYHLGIPRHTLYASFRTEALIDRDPARQILLGGDTGLRGFDARRFAGDRLALLTIEDRYYRGWSVLHLLDVGFGAFIDVGNAWYAGRGMGSWHMDVGVSLRLGLSKSAQAGVVNIDIAYPLDRVNGERAIVVNIGRFEY